MGIRFSPGCPACGCGCGPIKIRSINGCSGEILPSVAFAVREVDGAEVGPVVLEGNTGLTGVYQTDLPPGTYLVESIKDGWGTHATPQTVGCGGTYTIALYRRYVEFIVQGCEPSYLGNSSTLVGTKILISGEGHTYELLTDDAETARWYPEVPGSYAWTASHSSGLLGELSGTIAIDDVCTGDDAIDYRGGRLEPIAGRTCCYANYGRPDGDGLPRGKILVTTSAGDSWDFVGCYDLRCSYSDAGQQIGTGPGDEAWTDPPEPGGMGCPYMDFPADLHMGTVGLKIKIVHTETVDGVRTWRARLAPPEMWGLGRYEPMGYFPCTGLPIEGTGQISKSWYLDDGCYRPGEDNGWTWVGDAVVASEDPLSATIYFEGPASECWTWTGGLGDVKHCNPPPPLRSITLTEVA